MSASIKNEPKKKLSEFDLMIGKSFGEVVQSNPQWKFRIYHINRQPMIVTADHRTDRLNVDVIGERSNYVISKVIGFG